MSMLLEAQFILDVLFGLTLALFLAYVWTTDQIIDRLNETVAKLQQRMDLWDRCVMHKIVNSEGEENDE